MSTRALETAFLVIIMIAIVVGGKAWLWQIATFGWVSLIVLIGLAFVIVVAFRRDFLAGGPLARIHATRDAAFLAAIAGAIAFVLERARWSLGATIVALECALAIELLAGAVPAPAPKGSDEDLRV